MPVPILLAPLVVAVATQAPRLTQLGMAAVNGASQPGYTTVVGAAHRAATRTPPQPIPNSSNSSADQIPR